MGVTEITAAIRRPEYTGENRCLPCTALNVLLAVAVTITVAVVSLPAGGVVLLGGLLAIYFRGYLVPGTPELTKRYLPPAVLGLFGKEPAPRTLGTFEDGELWATLERADILVGEDDPTLAEGFRSRWLAAIDETRADEPGERAVERTLGVETADKRGERAFSIGGNRLVRWDSRAALLADVAAAAVFRDRYADWSALDPDARRDLLDRLRLLLGSCPACGGGVERGVDRVDPCCQRAHTVVWADCVECGALLAEIAVPTADEAEIAPLLDSDDGSE
ncbi:hypothetical protein [Halalkalicoccus jeotgali]|uniref:Uncharacterized protein n=1 Tax=Halalkalicoccus jeotgali (strain DSM 18796 / CECT 7217 / JCM 14584 / KCTC 4019 / B3) TaxID=795797 RepID=D8J9C5_HALJB|nr:hypothetical protein [Halalkalicoccus jeotgali]ADJ14337.1 hypothetical protein HacjB3_04730 [Halalkalicoccus jeotgali B3]ELY40600.1 hypothetical protein C497_03097 [Halalkalicoccus jeotgali B3]